MNSELKDYELEEALKHAREKIEAKRRMRERRKKQNEAFVWTPKNVAKIIRLNDKLWDLMHWFFHEGLYSLQDAVAMDPEEFHIYTRIFN